MIINRFKTKLLFAFGLGMMMFFLFYALSKSPAQVNSDWEIYENQTIGFSIKYPSDWEVTSESAYFKGLRVAFKSDGVELAIIQGATFYSEEEKRDLTFEEIVEMERKNSETHLNPTEEQIYLDGSPAISISYSRYWARGDQYIKTTHIYEKDNGFWIYISIYDYDQVKDSEYSTILTEMLKTFNIIQG